MRQSRHSSVPATWYWNVHTRAGGRLAKPINTPAPTRTKTIAATMPHKPRMSGGRVTSVEEDGLAGHEVRPRRREEEDERADLVEPPRAPHRNVAGQALVDFRIGEGLLVHVGDEPAGSNRVHLNVVARPLHAERARERHYPAFRSGIESISRQADGAEHRGEIDHFAGAPRDQVRCRRAAAVEDTGQVDVDDRAPVLGGGVGERCDAGNAGVVDDDVE